MSNGKKKKQQQETFDDEENDKLGALPTTDEQFEPPIPPDGGWGWTVMIASFFGNMIVDGVCYTYGIFFNDLQDYFQSTKSKTALVGALVPAVYLIVGPIVSSLANKFGCRIVTIIGGIIAAAFFVISCYSTDMNMMLVTYGVMGGVGFGFMYLPCIVMVGYYFDKKRAMATGIAVCGSSVGTFVFAPLGQYLLDEYGWKGANTVIGAIILNGIAIGLIFRPLEPVRKRPLLVKSTIMTKIADDKRRRTYSVDDQTYITEAGNQIVLHVDDTTAPHHSNASLGQDVVRNKQLDIETMEHGPRSRHASVSASQRSLNARKQAVASPFARKDILYTGSIQNTAEYKTCGGDMSTYVSSVLNVGPVEADGKTPSFWTPVVRIISEMFDFSLLKSPSFLLICASGVFGYLGLYTPFVYVTQKAVTELDIPASQASLILSVLGACNTVSRVATGFISDVPQVDCIIVHNVAAIVTGVSVGFVSVLNSYGLLMAFAVVFGIFMAPYIALRSIVLVEILGIQRLTNAFGLMSLFQGIACLIGSPMSGAIVDATGSYVGAFIVSGCMFVMAGLVLFPVRRLARWENSRNRQISRSKAAKVARNT
jgi:MFS family permease